MNRKEFKDLKNWLIEATIVDVKYDKKLKVLALTFDNDTILLVSTDYFCKGIKQ